MRYRLRLQSGVSRPFLMALTVLAMGLPARPANADPMREFVLSCSYGVLAGSLVGAATLAFTDKPGDNLNKIARGASIGLYAGILLGFYVVYGVAENSPEDESLNGLGWNQKFQLNQAAIKVRGPMEAPKFSLSPVFTERGLEGASMGYAVHRF